MRAAVEIKGEELEKVRQLCKEIRELTYRSIEQLIPRYIQLGEWVKKKTEEGASVRALARQLKEPGFGEFTLRYALKMRDASRTLYGGDIDKMVEDLKARLSEPLSWRRIIREFLVRERKPKAAKPEIQEIKAELKKPIVVEVSSKGSEAHIEKTQLKEEDSAIRRLLTPISESGEGDPEWYADLMLMLKGIFRNFRIYWLNTLRHHVPKDRLDLLAEDMDYAISELEQRVKTAITQALRK